MKRTDPNWLLSLGSCVLLVGILQPKAELLADQKTIANDAQKSAKSIWVAPNALFTEELGIEKNLANVQWYDSDGAPAKRLFGPGILWGKGIVEQSLPDGRDIYAADGTWMVSLPKRSTWPPGTHHVERNGDTLMERYLDPPGQSHINIYSKGGLVGSLGPFRLVGSSTPELDANANTSFIAWKDQQAGLAEAVVIGSDGKIKLKVDCPRDVDDPVSLGDHKGVLVPLRYTGSERLAEYETLFSEGKSVRFKSDGAISFALPNSELVLFKGVEPVGAKRYDNFSLVDAADGRTVWNVRSPVRPNPSSVTLATIYKDRVVLLGLDLAELDIKTGKTIAIWRSEKIANPPVPEFNLFNGELYINIGSQTFRVPLGEAGLQDKWCWDPPPPP